MHQARPKCAERHHKDECRHQVHQRDGFDLRHPEACRHGQNAYKKRETMQKYSYRATLDEIRENDYNLNIPRYVDTFEEEDPVDIQAVKKNIADIEAELAQVQEQMKKYLDELGL